jgi:hypothetical protein
VILLTLSRAEGPVAGSKIVGGGGMAGRISLRVIVKADSLPEAGRIVSTLPVWPLAETRVTPLAAFSERRASAKALL